MGISKFFSAWQIGTVLVPLQRSFYQRIKNCSNTVNVSIKNPHVLDLLREKSRSHLNSTYVCADSKYTDKMRMHACSRILYATCTCEEIPSENEGAVRKIRWDILRRMIACCHLKNSGVWSFPFSPPHSQKNGADSRNLPKVFFVKKPPRVTKGNGNGAFGETYFRPTRG